MASHINLFQEKVSQWQRLVKDFLWQADVDKLPLWERTLVRSSQIAVAVVRDLLQGQLSLRAMSLVFTTLIGFFPLLALTFAILKSLGVHNAMEPTLLTLLEPLGERSTEVTSQILGYVDAMQVELIGITSVGLLIFIVLDMMRKIELSFNYIWTVKQGRSWSSRVSEYLFAVIVSPLLLFISISITSSVNTNYFQTFLENLSYGGLVIQFTAFFTPILLMSLAFAFVYSFLPNTKVQFASAFIGGLVATIIWKFMGSIFAELFITSARESIYLAFATAIVVMIFTYFGWLVALVGSSIAFYHQFPAKVRNGRDQTVLSLLQQEEICLAVATMIIHSFEKGDPPLNELDINSTLNSSSALTEPALNNLIAIKLIQATNDDPPRYLPTKSVRQCSMFEIWQAIRRINSDTHSYSDDSHAMMQVKDFQAKIDVSVETALGEQRVFPDE
ncbi:MAG: YihY/virulence factor BrkB family protein [Pseudohongiellaceae bacterium]